MSRLSSTHKPPANSHEIVIVQPTQIPASEGDLTIEQEIALLKQGRSKANPGIISSDISIDPGILLVNPSIDGKTIVANTSKDGSLLSQGDYWTKDDMNKRKEVVNGETRFVVATYTGNGILGKIWGTTNEAEGGKLQALSDLGDIIFTYKDQNGDTHEDRFKAVDLFSANGCNNSTTPCLGTSRLPFETNGGAFGFSGIPIAYSGGLEVSFTGINGQMPDKTFLNLVAKDTGNMKVDSLDLNSNEFRQIVADASTLPPVINSTTREITANNYSGQWENKPIILEFPVDGTKKIYINGFGISEQPAINRGQVTNDSYSRDKNTLAWMEQNYKIYFVDESGQKHPIYSTTGLEDTCDGAWYWCENNKYTTVKLSGSDRSSIEMENMFPAFISPEITGKGKIVAELENVGIPTNAQFTAKQDSGGFSGGINNNTDLTSGNIPDSSALTINDGIALRNAQRLAQRYGEDASIFIAPIKTPDSGGLKLIQPNQTPQPTSVPSGNQFAWNWSPTSVPQPTGALSATLKNIAPSVQPVIQNTSVYGGNTVGYGSQSPVYGVPSKFDIAFNNEAAPYANAAMFIAGAGLAGAAGAYVLPGAIAAAPEAAFAAYVKSSIALASAPSAIQTAISLAGPIGLGATAIACANGDQSTCAAGFAMGSQYLSDLQAINLSANSANSINSLTKDLSNKNISAMNLRWRKELMSRGVELSPNVSGSQEALKLLNGNDYSGYINVGMNKGKVVNVPGGFTGVDPNNKFYARIVIDNPPPSAEVPPYAEAVVRIHEMQHRTRVLAGTYNNNTWAGYLSEDIKAMQAELNYARILGIPLPKEFVISRQLLIKQLQEELMR